MSAVAGVALERRAGWEARLAAVLEAARARPYELGTHDCFRLACAVVEALSGVDFWPEWVGCYRTKRQALRCLAAYAAGYVDVRVLPADPGNVFTCAFSRLFGGWPAPIAQARRGDIAEFVDAAGEQHLGVVNGAGVVVLRERGLDVVQRSRCAHAWRIG